MEQKYVNEFVQTEGLFVEQRLSPIYVGLAITFGVIASIFLAIRLWIIALVFIALVALMLVLRSGKVTALKAEFLSQMNNANHEPITIRTEFTDAGVKCIMKTASAILLDQTEHYSAILKVKKRMNLIVFCVDNGYEIPVEKKSFQIGTRERFMHFMSIKGC